ncbi:lysophospholipase [Luteibacter rhizovicinus DSM 16549]|uniref:Lysophospholipase n=1 Tax=Luteibacter rhizovicinus DSM 16549 TaxID=1440763 RepID=A0A0G9HBF2_9GAMM|nr:SGNH/GDSL hydrolase family protein [Luteibacter rhizovicinus]APG04049.1 lysophospholipase [Luteibacter rhizovicinus DSM 16549]KLD66569.1 lysophospholipase [Luteibacter rhizovicinus DSM 16549]KLD75045.1 lysophospholipase [Xanthomonas hyacinthi DSM 19077]
MAETTFLALGDSYTIGEGVPTEGRWPEQLVARLRERGVMVGDPRIIATTGWTTDELSGAMDEAGLRGSFGLVTLLIGVNNQYRGRSASEYREQFLALLHRAIALAGDSRRVVVVSIPDWGVTAFAEGRDRAAIGSDIDTFNAIAHDEAIRAHARWADVTPASRAAGAKPGMLVEDGLHPSAAQYALWVDAILPEAQAAVRELHR